MYAKVNSATPVGVDAFIIEVEARVENALPNFSIVGLPDAAVKESRERVAAAIKNSGFPYPSKKIVANLAPADIRKEGSGFDLPLAIAILGALGVVPSSAFEKTLFLGELSLEGRLRKVRGTLSIAIEAAKKGFKKIILPKENAKEAALQGEIEAIPVETLEETANYLLGRTNVSPERVDVEAIFAEAQNAINLDLSDVKGQENAKRALEVAAAGGHNLIMIGPPGSGKTMLAKRLPSILPPITFEEALETTKIHSIAGILPEGSPLTAVRPFRAPHHTISDAALVGGGMNKIKPGEVSLACHGVLFLDELPEFARNVLEVLRQPLEDKVIRVSRARLTVEYPANFMLVAAMNPCPCGNFGNPKKECVCSPGQIQKYLAKISGPLLDRIDIHVEVPAIDYAELSSDRTSESSKVVGERVARAREIQKERFKNEKGLHKNADMSSRDLRKYVKLEPAAKSLLEMAMDKLSLSARAYDRAQKVALTIADLDGSETVKAEHISEAVQYRSLDREYWKY